MCTFEKEMNKIRFYMCRKKLISIRKKNDKRQIIIFKNGLTGKYELYDNDYRDIYKDTVSIMDTYDLSQLLHFVKNKINIAYSEIESKIYDDNIFDFINKNFTIGNVVKSNISTYSLTIFGKNVCNR